MRATQLLCDASGEPLIPFQRTIPAERITGDRLPQLVARMFAHSRVARRGSPIANASKAESTKGIQG